MFSSIAARLAGPILFPEVPAAGRRRYICGWNWKPPHMDPIATGLRKDIEAPGAMDRIGEAARIRRAKGERRQRAYDKGWKTYHPVEAIAFGFGRPPRHAYPTPEF